MVLSNRTQEKVPIQICKWIHGNPANPENVCFRLSINFFIDLGFPDRTWTSLEWEYGIGTCIGARIGF
jgi:hypothetical protein